MGYSGARGFSLVEVLIAMVLVAGAVASLSWLGLRGLEQTNATHHAGQTLLLAQAKLDELRAATWGFDAAGIPVSDPALALTAALTLTAGGSSTAEQLNRFGQPAASPGEAAYTRRWSVSLYDAVDPDTLLLQACVESIRAAAAHASRRCLVTLRTRQP